MLRTKHEGAILEFARGIIAARTGETIEVTDNPELLVRNAQAVEELWASASRRYAVEHTRIESFENQIESEARLGRLLMPVRSRLAGRVPGAFALTVWDEARTAKVNYASAQDELCRLVLEAAPQMELRETRDLVSSMLPFRMQIYRRRADGAQVDMHRAVGDLETLRLERVRRAFREKMPKLGAAAVDGRESVFVIESNDIQLASAFDILETVKVVLGERADPPDRIVLVETEGEPWTGWIFKEGVHVVPFLDSEHRFECR